MSRRSQAIILSVYSFFSMVFIVLFMIYRERALPSVMLVIWLLGTVVEFVIYKPKAIGQARWIRLAALCVGLSATLAFFFFVYAMHLNSDALLLALMIVTIVAGGLVSWMSDMFPDPKQS